MDTAKKRGVFTGTLFITAIITSLLGGGILESALSRQDYLTNIPANTGLIYTGILLELINAIAVIGIAVTVFPVIKRQSESIALGYVGFRIIESLFCILSAFIPLIMVSLILEPSGSSDPDNQYSQVLRNILLSARLDMAEIFIPLFFSLGAFLFYYLLFRLKLVPRYISIWGFTGAVLIFMQIVIESGMVLNLILVLPIIINEIFLGIWLIVTGFNESSVIPGSAPQI